MQSHDLGRDVFETLWCSFTRLVHIPLKIDNSGQVTDTVPEAHHDCGDQYQEVTRGGSGDVQTFHCGSHRVDIHKYEVVEEKVMEILENMSSHSASC